MSRVKKSLMKTVSWLLVSFVLLLIVTFLFTGHWLVSMEIALVELALKSVIYYAHEHLWEHGLEP